MRERKGDIQNVLLLRDRRGGGGGRLYFFSCKERSFFFGTYALSAVGGKKVNSKKRGISYTIKCM